MSYIGNTTQNQNYVPAIDYFNGDGATTAFTLSRPVASVAAVQAVISNVPQNPGSAFTVSGSTITFTSAPPSGTANIYVYYTSPNTQVVQPGQGTVTTTSIADGSVTPAKLSTGYPYWNTSGVLGVNTTAVTSYLDGKAVIYSSGDNYVNIVSGSASAAGCMFQDTTGTSIVGGTRYTHSDNKLGLWSNGTEQLAIDSSGRVTMPYQPVFSVRDPTAATSYTTNSTVVFSSVGLNVGSSYSASTGKFTAPVAGNYQFTASMLPRDRSGGTYWYVQFVKNGSATGYSIYFETFVVNTISSTMSIALAAGDTMEMRVAIDGSSVRFWSESTFSGFLIG